MSGRSFTATFFLLTFSLYGCVFRFTNDVSHLATAQPESVYLPAAQDVSEEGGQSLRISKAVRRAIALDTRFVLSSKENARVALDLKIVSGKRTAVEIKECKQGTEDLAGGSRNCKDLKNDFRFPNAASEKERRVITLRARVIHLQTGKVINQSDFKDVSSGDYEVVGADAEKGELSATPELHALRYLENNDAAVDRMGNTLSALILAMLLASPRT
jgi:hypothetical protein